MKTVLNRILRTGILFYLISFNAHLVFSQETQIDTTRTANSRIDCIQKKNRIRMTTLTFGGNGISVTKVSNELSIMTGGRGSATFYYQISLGKLFRFEMGSSYRYIRGTNLMYISDRNLSGFSCYLGFLVKAGN